jgi:hypothetical protein
MSRAPDVVAFGSGLIDAPNRVCKATPDRMKETSTAWLKRIPLLSAVQPV